VSAAACCCDELQGQSKEALEKVHPHWLSLTDL
jgi:hypothetical protein